MTRRPAPTGEYAVGTMTYTVYDDRDEVLAPGTKRSIPARVYYPVDKASIQGMNKLRYMSPEMAKALKKYMHAPINYEKSEAAGENFSECYENAPKVADNRFPLIMFSHGLGSYREANSFLCIELASHGYVVISVGHPYDGICTELDDGTKVEFSKECSKRQYEPFWPGVFSILKLTKTKGTERELAEKFDVLQKKYCKFINSRIDEWVKDTLSALEYAKENLADMIDFECGVGVSGHSLGGATAYMLCLESDEFVCGANIDGALFGNNMGKTQNRPFVQISCSANRNAETRAFIDHSAPVIGAVFQKMQHLGFSDMKHLIPVKAIVGALDADVMHENICKLHLELFDTYLKKNKDHPEVQGNEFIQINQYQSDVQ